MIIHIDISDLTRDEKLTLAVCLKKGLDDIPCYGSCERCIHKNVCDILMCAIQSIEFY